MGISPKLLGEGEHVIVSTRTHWKALVIPVIVLILVCGVGGFLVAIRPSGGAEKPVLWATIVVALIAIVWFTLKPLALWLSASYTVTNRRLINRSGIFTRRGRDIPLYLSLIHI